MSAPIRPGANTLTGDAVGVYRETKVVAKCKSGRFVAEMGRITSLQDTNSEHFDLRVRSGVRMQIP